MIALTINGQPTEVPEGASLLEAAEGMGIKVPTLCHHKALLPYGACRLCLVEVEVPGRPASVQASCTLKRAPPSHRWKWRLAMMAMAES